MRLVLKVYHVLLLLVITVPIKDVNGQILRLGHCPSFSALPDFEMEKVKTLQEYFHYQPSRGMYLGTWYQIERYFSFTGMGGKCWAQTYYNDPEVPGRFKLQMEYRDHIVENKLTTEMDIYQDMPDDPATLTSQMFGMPFTASDYQVLSTDYTNYAIEWRCEDRGLFQRRESLWILARTPFPKPWVMKEARGLVQSLGLKMSSLRPVSQDCHMPGRINLFHQSLKRKHFHENGPASPEMFFTAHRPISDQFNVEKRPE